MPSDRELDRSAELSDDALEQALAFVAAAVESNNAILTDPDAQAELADLVDSLPDC